VVIQCQSLLCCVVGILFVCGKIGKYGIWCFAYLLLILDQDIPTEPEFLAIGSDL